MEREQIEDKDNEARINEEKTNMNKIERQNQRKITDARQTKQSRDKGVIYVMSEEVKTKTN